MTYVRLYNDCGILIDEIEVNKDESVLHAISESMWCLNNGDTIKIVEGTDDMSKQDFMNYLSGSRYVTRQDVIDDLTYSFGISEEEASKYADDYFGEE